MRTPSTDQWQKGRATKTLSMEDLSYVWPRDRHPLRQKPRVLRGSGARWVVPVPLWRQQPALPPDGAEVSMDTEVELLRLMLRDSGAWLAPGADWRRRGRSLASWPCRSPSRSTARASTTAVHRPPHRPGPARCLAAAFRRRRRQGRALLRLGRSPPASCASSTATSPATTLDAGPPQHRRPDELAYYFASAPLDATVADLVRIAGCR